MFKNMKSAEQVTHVSTLPRNSVPLSKVPINKARPESSLTTNNSHGVTPFPDVSSASFQQRIRNPNIWTTLPKRIMPVEIPYSVLLQQLEAQHPILALNRTATITAEEAPVTKKRAMSLPISRRPPKPIETEQAINPNPLIWSKLSFPASEAFFRWQKPSSLKV